MPNTPIKIVKNPTSSKTKTHLSQVRQDAKR
jgi:hypothetical protein